MESKLIGIPVVVWFFLIGLALLVDGFIWFFVYTPERKQLTNLDMKASVILHNTLPSPTLTATPTATATPTLSAPVKVFVPQTSTVVPTK